LIGGSTLTYDDAGQVATKTTGGVPTSFGYDTRGNRTSEGATRTYAYDQANRMKSVTTGGATSTYAYDGDGMRSSKTTSGSTNAFVHDQAEGLPLILADATNTYLYGPGGTPIEQVDGSNNATYLHADQLGSRLGIDALQKNVLVRIVLRAHDHTLSDDDANELRNRIYSALHMGTATQWACR
jgi:YD repeat-containing protein